MQHVNADNGPPLIYIYILASCEYSINHFLMQVFLVSMHSVISVIIIHICITIFSTGVQKVDADF